MEDGHVIIELPKDEYERTFGPISPRVADYFAGKTITSADRIRAMTDEELAEFMANLGCHPSASKETCMGVDQCCSCWLDWLKQEAKL